jgi:hypothetical protein
MTMDVRRHVLILPFVLWPCAMAVAQTQSLADLARREQERRKAITTPSKVYSNETLPDAPMVSIVGEAD